MTPATVTYYQLRCVTCDEVHLPLCATVPAELLCPDYGEMIDGNLSTLAAGLEGFHERHNGHALTVITVNCIYPEGKNWAWPVGEQRGTA